MADDIFVGAGMSLPITFHRHSPLLRYYWNQMIDNATARASFLLCSTGSVSYLVDFGSPREERLRRYCSSTVALSVVAQIC